MRTYLFSKDRRVFYFYRISVSMVFSACRSIYIKITPSDLISNIIITEFQRNINYSYCIVNKLIGIKINSASRFCIYSVPKGLKFRRRTSLSIHCSILNQDTTQSNTSQNFNFCYHFTCEYIHS